MENDILAETANHHCHALEAVYGCSYVEAAGLAIPILCTTDIHQFRNEARDYKDHELSIQNEGQKGSLLICGARPNVILVNR